MFSFFFFKFGLLAEFEKLGFCVSNVLPTFTKAKKWPVRFFVWLRGLYSSETDDFDIDDMIHHLPYTILFLIASLPTTFAYTLYIVLSLIAVISGIVWTEETIRVNNIDLSAATITSSGQLISLIVTIFTSIPIWWTMLSTLIAKWNRKRAKYQ